MSYLQNFKYEVYGQDSSPKMVFLHGLMGSGVNWRKIISQFEGDYQVLSFDQRGHGRSFKPESGYMPEDYAIDLKLILDELGWHKIHLVGHSMGGRNALRFSYKFPNYLSSLVIEDIGPEGNPDAMARTKNLIEVIPTPFESKAAAKKYFKEEFFAKQDILGSYLLTNIEERADGSADWRFSKAGILESLKSGHLNERWDEVKAISCPCLWIRGGNSDDLTQAEFIKIQEANPSIRAEEIPEAGHWVHFEKAPEFIELLKSFYSNFPAL